MRRMRRRGALALAVGVCLAVVGAAQAGPIGYTVQSNGNDHLYSIDLATGVATDLGALNFDDAEGLAFVGDQLYAIGGSVSEFWNITTPPGSLVGNTGSRNGLDAGLDYNPVTGIMYNMNGSPSGSSLYTINIATGAATLVGSTSQFADSLAINSAGQAFAAGDVNTNGLLSVNLATGATSLIGNFSIGMVQTGMSFDDNDILWMITSDGKIYTVDTSTGAVTFQANITLNGNPIAGFEGLAIQRTPVPEPSTLASAGLATAFGLFLGWRRRRRVLP